MKAASLFAALLVLGGASSASAQQDPANMKIVAEKIRADKKLLVASNMGLTEAEGAKFWPVYDAYQADLQKLTQRTVTLIKDYAGSYKAMTDDVAGKLLNEMVAIEKDRAALMASYQPKFAGAIPTMKVARYYQIENKVRAVVQYELADAIPLIP
jgi:hypothetical protein